MSHNLTSYGPGKFNLLVDVVAWDASLDGCAEKAGDVSEFGEHHSLVVDTDGFTPEMRIKGDPELSDADRRFLLAQCAAIVRENDQGFVEVDWFDDMKAAREAWRRIEEAFTEESEESDEYD